MSLSLSPFQVKQLKTCGGRSLGDFVKRMIDMLLSVRLQNEVNYSGKNLEEKARQEVGSKPNSPLGFKDTFLHVIKSESTCVSLHVTCDVNSLNCQIL